MSLGLSKYELCQNTGMLNCDTRPDTFYKYTTSKIADNTTIIFTNYI